MNHNRILVDTGPLVALLRANDAHHESCVVESQSLPYPFLTSWPVITEAAWLLHATPDGVAMLLKQIETKLVEIVDLDARAVGWMRAFLAKYRDLGAQLADASLCYLSERDNIESIFTLDRRDFMVYRSSKNRPFHLLPESLSG